MWDCCTCKYSPFTYDSVNHLDVDVSCGNLDVQCYSVI